MTDNYRFRVQKFTGNIILQLKKNRKYYVCDGAYPYDMELVEDHIYEDATFADLQNTKVLSEISFTKEEFYEHSKYQLTGRFKFRKQAFTGKLVLQLEHIVRQWNPLYKKYYEDSASNRLGYSDATFDDLQIIYFKE